MVAPDDRSRRALLGGALAGAGAWFIAGCGSSRRTSSTTTGDTPRYPGAPTPDDIPVLAAALALERRTIAAYVACQPLLPRPQARFIQQFLQEELQHSGELIALIKATGAKAPDRADSYEIGDATDTREALALLAEFEQLQLRSYLGWITDVAPGPTRAALGTILASDAQHVAALRQARGGSLLTMALPS